MRALRGAALLCLLLTSLCLTGQALDWHLDQLALQESLESLRPWQRIRSLADRGLYRDYCAQNSWEPDSQGLSCIGRWSCGPSYKVSVHTVGLDTIILLTRGSGATLARFRTTGQVAIEPLGEIDCHGIPHRAVMSGSLVCVGVQRGGTGLEVFDASDLTAPRRTAYVSLPSINDIAVYDTLVYLACADDSLRIYSIADPAAPVRIGACRDTSDLAMCYADGYCYLVHASGINIVDVRDPRNPHRAGKIAGNAPLAVQVRDSLCYMTTESAGLRVYDVADPATPVPVGSLSVPAAADLCLPQNCDTLAVTSYLHLISIASPSSPRLVGQVNSQGWDDGVGIAPALDYAFIADHFDGVVAVDITNPVSPAIDTMALAGGLAVDINIDNGRAYIGSEYTGLTLLDVTDPARPTRMGGIDLVGEAPKSYAVVAQDSFAYLCWTAAVPFFRSVDISDPSSPRLAGGYDVFGYPRDMVVRDSLCYVAQDRRLQILNVARPREPRLVGICVIQDGVWGLTVRDTLAFVAGVSLQVANVADASAPRLVGTIDRGCIGVAVDDTFAYVPSWDTLFVYSIADPAQARVLSTTPTGRAWDVTLGDSLLFIGTNDGVEAYSVSNPVEPRRTGQAAAPYSNRRLCYAGGYLYSAIWDAGVAVYETTTTGLTEHQTAMPVVAHCILATPNPASRFVRLAGVHGVVNVVVHDAVGRVRSYGSASAAEGSIELDLAGLSSGVYFVNVKQASRTEVVRFVKR